MKLDDECKLLGLIALYALSQYDPIELKRATDKTSTEIQAAIDELLKYGKPSDTTMQLYNYRISDPEFTYNVAHKRAMELAIQRGHADASLSRKRH